MSRAGETSLDRRWKVIPALHWPFTEKVYQLLVCLITSILFKPLYFGVSCNSQSILCLTLQPGCAPQSPLPFSSGTLAFLWSLIVSTILLATGPLPCCSFCLECFSLHPAWLTLTHSSCVSSGITSSGKPSLTFLTRSNPQLQALLVPYPSLHNAVQLAILQ